MKRMTLLLFLTFLFLGQPGEILGKASEKNILIITLDGVRNLEFLNDTDGYLSNGDHAPTFPNLWENLRQRLNFYGIQDEDSFMYPGNFDFISLPGYHSIFGGKIPFQCHDNDCG